jgi:hypothetical protein
VPWALADRRALFRKFSPGGRRLRSAPFFLRTSGSSSSLTLLPCRCFKTPGEKSMKIDFTKLLGFQTLATTDNLDLGDETVADKLGARVGGPEPASPSNGIDFAEDSLGARLGAKVSVEVQ